VALFFLYNGAYGGIHMMKVYEITIESTWKIMQRWIRINVDSIIAIPVSHDTDGAETTNASTAFFATGSVDVKRNCYIHQKPKRELFRTAHQCGLISDPEKWWTFFEGRNNIVTPATWIWQLFATKNRALWQYRA